MEPQKALETATVNQLRLLLGYSADECKRTFQGRPDPAWRKTFVSVWSQGDVVNSRRENTFLREVRGLEVTISVPIGEMIDYDRWVKIQDVLEEKMNRIVEVIHRDCFDFSISNAAEVLAQLDGTGQPIGFRGCLTYLSTGKVQEVGPSWWMAKPGSGVSGIIQQASFGKSVRIRNLEYLL